MRGFAVLCCAGVLSLAQATTTVKYERQEFSGLTSPCDEVSVDQADTVDTSDVTNDDLTDQIAELLARVNNELVTYGDTSNECSSTFCAIGGGQNNKIDSKADFGFIRGGKANWCYESSPYCAINGGQSNIATGDYCSIGGGIKNKCYSNYGTIGGGYLNMADARFSTVLGGSKNTASGRYSFVFGQNGKANADYSATIALNGEDCANDVENSIAVCADSFKINGVEYIDQFSSRRVLEQNENNCKGGNVDVDEEEKRLQSYEAIVTVLADLLK